VIHHYELSTLGVKSKACVNYRNFKRAYARLAWSRVGKFTESSERKLIRLGEREVECGLELAHLREEKERLLKRKAAPSQFRAILSQSCSPPVHLKASRRRA
jgi:hypothetical protein